jgi:hypothetical protein
MAKMAENSPIPGDSVIARSLAATTWKNSLFRSAAEQTIVADSAVRKTLEIPFM